MNYPTDHDFEEARTHRQPPGSRRTREHRIEDAIAAMVRRYPDLRDKLQQDYIDGTWDFRRELVEFIANQLGK